MAKLYALIPAAGGGTRMDSDIPKQYLPLCGKPVLFHALSALGTHREIQHMFVVLAASDKVFARQNWAPFTSKLSPLYCGGATRAQSVINGLLAVRNEMQSDDWILVHDAVRPCLTLEALDRLIEGVRQERVGGLLAQPVVDTLKRGDADNYVITTQARDNLWQAQTPQMFRYRLLLEALRGDNGARATDEASAIEQLGLHPKLVPGDARNLKVTYPHDLALAELILKATSG